MFVIFFLVFSRFLRFLRLPSDLKIIPNNVLTGEPIVEFTGVHQNHARGEMVQDWAYTTMNSDEKWERERTVSKS